LLYTINKSEEKWQIHVDNAVCCCVFIAEIVLSENKSLLNSSALTHTSSA